MARFISCQACSAPVPYDLTSSVATCGHCGATVAVPSDERDPFVERLKTLDQQWREARRRYMVKDADGNLLPPPEHSFAGMMISVTGMLPLIAIAMLLGALAVAESPWLVPLVFLLPPLAMGSFFGFGYWAMRVHDRSDERYRAFRRIRIRPAGSSPERPRTIDDCVSSGCRCVKVDQSRLPCGMASLAVTQVALTLTNLVSRTGRLC